MKRVMLKVAYDGTNYCGWQGQPNGITVQQVLNECLTEFCGEPIHTIGASRTDAGVHARGNVAVFDTAMRMPGDKFSFALNTRLPGDIRIDGSREVPADFHPRFTDTVKTYEYRILNRQFPDPTRRIGSFFTYYSMDIERMQAALPYLIGEHDFRSFQASGDIDPARSTVRTVYSATIGREEDMITFRIQGNGFLYHMVRIIAGTLMEIGNARWEPEDMGRIIEARDRSAAGDTAPACGLTLLEIRYPAWGF